MPSSQPSTEVLTQRHRRHWMVFGLLALALIGVVVLLAGRYGAEQADRALGERGMATGALYVSTLQAELDKQEAVPFLVARDADVRDALEQPTPAAFERLNAKLETLSQGVRASVIYLIDTSGLAVAASNYRTDTSFVGNQYAFRAYFQQAMAEGTGQLFALGSVSNRPGLYMAERIDGADGPLGVVVVKVEFDAIEAAWQTVNDVAYVTDARGVVLLTDVIDWRFSVLEPIGPAMVSSLRESLQFGAAPLALLPVQPAHPTSTIEAVTASVPGASRSQSYLRVLTPVPGKDWTLHLLLPMAGERAASIGAAQASWLLALLPLLAIAAAALRYLQRASRLRAEQASQRAMLETGIAERTADLTAANRQLRDAMAEREAAQTRETQLREDLAQSNRLAVLGQIAAGVAHEINQPVGAIRAYAENGVTLLERDNAEDAKGNLNAITLLTERIGTITDQLRGFARKSERAIAPTDLADAVDAAMQLLGGRLRSHPVALSFERPNGPITVLADRLGLEQIIINLVQNGLEALDNQPDPALQLTIATSGDSASLTVADNGPGIPPAIFAQLFIPFSTSKPKGLGLGLVISHDLAVAFGGTLAAATPDGTGASFTLTLRRAT